MSSAPAAQSAPTAQPDQPATTPAPATTPTPATAPAEPSPIGRVISIVRWLIAYGTLLATAVREHPAEPLARTLVYWFQTRDLGVILRRLTRGLMRAAALEAWLRERAAGGHELRRPTAIRLSSPGNPRSGPPAAGDAKAPPWWHDPNHVPTMEEAAAEVRSSSGGRCHRRDRRGSPRPGLRLRPCDVERAEGRHQLLRRRPRASLDPRHAVAIQSRPVPRNMDDGAGAALATAAISGADAGLRPPALNLRAGRRHRGVTRTGPATAGPAVAIRSVDQDIATEGVIACIPMRLQVR